MNLRRWGLVAWVGLAGCGKAVQSGSGDNSSVGGATPSVGGATANGGHAASSDVRGGAGPTTAAGGTMSSAGSAGMLASVGDSGTGGAAPSDAGTGGIVYTLGPDPLPVAEPAAVVETSSNYLVVNLEQPYTRLAFIDLEGNSKPIILNADGTYDRMRALSKDRRAYVYAQTDPYQFPEPKPRANDLYLSRFTDSGYLQGAVVSGYAERPGTYTPLSFDASSRFAVLVRWAPTRGFEFIDVARNTRHAALDFANPDVSVSWAPTGYLFAFSTMTAAAGVTPSFRKQYIAKLIEGGISQPQPLPDDVVDRKFTADGRRLFYLVRNGTDPISFGYVEPPAVPHQFYASTGTGNLTTGYGFLIENAGTSVLAQLAVADDPNQTVVWRLFSDESIPPVALTEPRHFVALAQSSAGLLALTSQADDGNYRLELLRGSQHFTISARADGSSLTAFFVGERLIYDLSTADSYAHEIHSVTLDGSQVVDRAVGTPDRGRIYHCPPAPRLPDNRLSYSYYEPRPGFRFIDLALTGSAATRTADLSDPAATIATTVASGNCPVCNAAGDTCAYLEKLDDHSKIFSVHFGPNGPSEPKLVYEGDGITALLAAHIP